MPQTPGVWSNVCLMLCLINFILLSSTGSAKKQLLKLNKRGDFSLIKRGGFRRSRNRKNKVGWWKVKVWTGRLHSARFLYKECCSSSPLTSFATVVVEGKNRLCISPSVSRQTKRQLFLQDQTWLQGVMADSSSPSFSSLVTAQVSFSQASSGAKSFYFLFMHFHLRQKYEMNHCKNMSVGLKGCNVSLKSNHLKWLIEKAVILNIHVWFCRIWVLRLQRFLTNASPIVSARFTIYESLKSWTKEDSKVSCRM